MQKYNQPVVFAANDNQFKFKLVYDRYLLGFYTHKQKNSTSKRFRRKTTEEMDDWGNGKRKLGQKF